MKRTVTKRLYGKPSERLILLGICEKYNLQSKVDEVTGNCTVSGDSENVTDAMDLYDKVIATAYKRLAFTQASNKFADIPIKTLNSEFMQAFATVAYSLFTGKAFMYIGDTEAKRAGLKAVSEIG